MFKEFKEFAVKGNVIGLAIGIVIGGAFAKIVDSFVKDILMPPLGLLIAKVDFTNLYISLTGAHYATLEEAQKAGAPTLNYGLFLNNLINFVIVAFAIFLVIKQVNRLKKPTPTAAPVMKSCPQCCTDIPMAAKRCPACTSQL